MDKTASVFREPDAGGPASPAPASRDAQLTRVSTGEPIAIQRDLTILGRSSNNVVVVDDAQASRRHASILREGEAYWIEDLGHPNGTWVNNVPVTGRAALKSGDVIRVGETEFSFGLSSEAAPHPGPLAEALPIIDLNSGVEPEVAGGPISELMRRLDAPKAILPGPIAGLIQSLDAPASPAQVHAPQECPPPTVQHKAPRALKLLLRAGAGAVSGRTFIVGEAGATLGRAGDNTIHVLDERLSRRHAQIEFKDGGYWLSDRGSANGTFVNQTPVVEPRRLQSGDVIEFGGTRLVVTLKAE